MRTTIIINDELEKDVRLIAGWLHEGNRSLTIRWMLRQAKLTRQVAEALMAAKSARKESNSHGAR